MGNKCCRSIKAKYFSHFETQASNNSQFYDDDELIITKDEITKMRKASTKSLSFVEMELMNSKQELADSNSFEYLKTIRDYMDSKPVPKKQLQIKDILSDYLYEGKEDLVSDVNFHISKDSIGFFVQIDYFEIIKQNINDFGIEYCPVLEIVLPGIKKKYEFSPIDDLNSNEEFSDVEKGRLQMKKLNNSHVNNSSIRKDYKLFFTKIKQTFNIRKEYLHEFAIMRIKYKIDSENREKSKLEKFIGSLDDEVILGENKFPFYQLIKENEFNGSVEIYSNQINRIGNVKIRYIIIDYANISDNNSDLDNFILKNLKNDMSKDLGRRRSTLIHSKNVKKRELILYSFELSEFHLQKFFGISVANIQKDNNSLVSNSSINLQNQTNNTNFNAEGKASESLNHNYLSEKDLEEIHKNLSNESFDIKSFLQAFYSEASRNKDNLICIFDFIGLCIDLIDSGKNIPILSLILNLNDSEETFFYDIPRIAIKNNNYLILSNYFSLVQKVKSIGNSDKKFIQKNIELLKDQRILEIIFAILPKMNQIAKRNLPNDMNKNKIRNGKVKRLMRRENILFDVNEIGDFPENIDLLYIKDCFMWIVLILGQLISFQDESVLINIDNNTNSVNFQEMIMTKINQNNDFILKNISFLCESLEIFLIYSNIVNETLKLISKAFNMFYGINYLNAKILKTSSSNVYMAATQAEKKKGAIANKKGVNSRNIEITDNDIGNNPEQKKIFAKLLHILKIDYRKLEDSKHLYKSYMPPTLIIVLRKYHVYPEVFNSILVILNIITSDLDPETLMNFFIDIRLDEMNSYLNSFKGLYFNSYSILFLNFLNLLMKFAEIEFEAIPQLKEKSAVLYKIVTEIVKSFFSVYLENLEVLRNFKSQKKQNLEIHGLFLRLSALITRLSKGAVTLLKSNLLSDTLEYLIYINERKTVFKEYEMITGKSKQNLAELFSSIVENSLIIVINFFNCYDDMKTKMVRQDIKDLIISHLKSVRILDKQALSEMFYKSIAFLESNNCASNLSFENLYCLINLIEIIDFFNAEIKEK